MRLAVFGETTRTKHYILNRALTAGFSVNVLENSDSKSRTRKNLSVFKTKTQDLKSIQRVTKDTDAVLCLLQNPQHENTETMNFVKNLISCMENNAIRRLVIFSCIQEKTVSKSAVSRNPITALLSKLKKNHDPTDITEILSESNIDWTIVGHPPVAETLSEDIAEIKENPEKFRLDLAKHMINQITDVTYIHDTLLLPA